MDCCWDFLLMLMIFVRAKWWRQLSTGWTWLIHLRVLMLLWQFDKLGAGWDEYCEQNITNEHHMQLLRHIGNLFFDVINFCELQQEVNLSWTVPLTNLHLQQDSRADPPIHEKIVTSSLQPHFSQDSSTSVCFYQSFHSADPYTLLSELEIT
nr:uncharacterized protein LOC113717967 isoform X2 [Coffea arabica]